MGLAICKKFVTLMGGTIKVVSKLGSGARFEVRLPVLTEPELSQSQSLTLPLELKATKRILVVDDQLIGRESTKDIVTELGYLCDTAKSGPEALNMILTDRYDAILLDIQMPEMDGLEVAKAIRQNSGPNRDVAIIAYSAGVEQTQQNSELFTNFLPKPFAKNGVRNMLRLIFSKQ